MRILITGGTGFVGGWSAVSLAEAGHDLRFLVRDPARLAPLGEMGVDISDHVTGGITDADAVNRALEGCDSVVHCAATVAIDPRHDAEVQATNLAGAQAVLGGAAERGLDPIIHTSSITSLFRPGLKIMTSDLETGETDDAYGISKAAVENYARSLQADGAPVVISYPGMVVGPGIGGRFGEVAEGFETVLVGRVIPGWDAGWLMIDVRDLAEIHTRAMVPGMGPRRFMAGGTFLDVARIGALFTEATGNYFIRLPILGISLRLIGTMVESVTSPMGVNTAFTRSAMEYYTNMPPSDDSAVHDDLGIEYRDPVDTFTDCIASLAEAGRVSRSQAGRAARST